MPEDQCLTFVVGCGWVPRWPEFARNFGLHDVFIQAIDRPFLIIRERSARIWGDQKNGRNCKSMTKGVFMSEYDPIRFNCQQYLLVGNEILLFLGTLQPSPPKRLAR
jgi:hypothetical protein